MKQRTLQKKSKEANIQLLILNIIAVSRTVVREKIGVLSALHTRVSPDTNLPFSFNVPYNLIISTTRHAYFTLLEMHFVYQTYLSSTQFLLWHAHYPLCSLFSEMHFPRVFFPWHMNFWDTQFPKHLFSQKTTFKIVILCPVEVNLFLELTH